MSIILRKQDEITEKSDVFKELQAIYLSMGMKDDLLSHSPGRIFEYPWTLSMIDVNAPNLRVLDAGCGSSPLPIYLKNKGITDVTGLDIQSSFDNPTFSFKPEWVDKYGINYVQGNILNYRSKVYDIVLCVSVLEHIFRPTDRIKAIINLWENVRDGGKLILTYDFMQHVAVGLQYILAGIGRTVDCVNYMDKITAICIQKVAREGQAEWIQANTGV